LLMDQLRAERTTALHLPFPVDTRAKQLADLLVADPGAALGRASDQVGASRRTLERLFAAETQMSLAGWRRRARILAAIALMSDGRSVTRSAMAVGYATPSSFVTAFRSELGATPRNYMAATSAAQR
jgi:AraC-like DNA-binding protein